MSRPGSTSDKNICATEVQFLPDSENRGWVLAAAVRKPAGANAVLLPNGAVDLGFADPEDANPFAIMPGSIR